MRKYAIIIGVLSLCLVNRSHGGIIANPSFEMGYHDLMPSGRSTYPAVTMLMPNDWQWRKQGNMNGHTSGLYYWCTDGQWSLYLFASTAGSHSSGNYLEFYQTVDIPAFSQLSLDVYLRGGTYTNSYVSINHQKLWTNNQAEEYSLILDTSQFQGLCEIEIGVEVFQSFGNDADGWTYFDNLQIIPEPATVLLLSLGSLVLSGRKRKHIMF